MKRYTKTTNTLQAVTKKGKFEGFLVSKCHRIRRKYYDAEVKEAMKLQKKELKEKIEHFRTLGYKPLGNQFNCGMLSD